MTIGVTGHQDLINSVTREWLKEQIMEEIRNKSFDNSYSCLAKGADQLFAEIVLEKGIPLVAIIPCEKYEEAFDIINVENYILILSKTSSKIKLEFENPSEEAFYFAGKLIVDKSDILLAVWNNLPSRGLGGTADIVGYAKSLGKKIVHFNPVNRTKQYINWYKSES